MHGAVLYDQSSTALRMGTGIATYGRNVAVAARAAGFTPQALLSTETRVDPADPVMSEVQLYDAERAALLPWLKPARRALAGALRAPFGYRPVALPEAGVVLRPGAEAPAFDRVFAERALFEAARVRFFLRGRFTEVRLSPAPALFHATYPLPVRVPGCPNLVTVHDLVPLRLPYMTLDNKRFYYRLVRRHLEAADHVIAVSEHAKRDMMALFGVPESRISVTWQGVALPASALARPQAEVDEEVFNLFELEPRGFYLFIGALEPKKNVARLIDAYAASGSRRPLVVAGGAGWQNEAEHERIADPRFTQYRMAGNTISSHRRVRRIPYLRTAQLVALMRAARALLFPSLYEGFGLPVLEAMTVGTPVMTSDATSLPEVAGDAALLVDPYDVTAMAQAIRRLDNDEDLLRELAARGPGQAERFSMERYAERLGEVYRRVK